MFEIFLFISPMGVYCYQIEKQLHYFINKIGLNISYHVVPLTNVHLLQVNLLQKRKIRGCCYDFSYYTILNNHILRTYHAIKIAYGNRKARTYLFELQTLLKTSSDPLIIKMSSLVIKNLHLSNNTIKSICQSSYLRSSIKQDQEVAKKWHIRRTPTTVIFNEQQTQKKGILLEGPTDQETLLDLFLPINFKKQMQQPARQVQYLHLL